MASGLEAQVTFVVTLLAGALAVGLIAQRFNIPYTVALLLAALPFHHPQPTAFGTQVLFIFLPALVFEAAWNLDRRALLRKWKPIAFLAVPGVVFTALLIGYGLSWSGQLPLREGILLGSIIAATDPIAVTATFRRLHVPHDLAVIVEGESLFNDGTALVLSSIVILSLTTNADAAPISMTLHSLLMTLGGVAIGLLIAGAIALLLPGADAMLQIVASVVAAYGSYLVADSNHLSGLFAALTTGIALQAFERTADGERAHREVDRFWAVLAFFANSLVFLLMGMRIDPARILHEPKLVVSTFCLMLLARLALTYGPLRPLLSGARRTAWQHVIAIAGMRGALSLAIALTLPASIPFRAPIIDAVFAIVTGTLVLQGLAIAPMLRRLFPMGDDGLEPPTSSV